MHQDALKKNIKKYSKYRKILETEAKYQKLEKQRKMIASRLDIDPLLMQRDKSDSS